MQENKYNRPSPPVPAPGRRQSAACRAMVHLLLAVYLLVGGVVPRGYMPAPLASGTAFHLCPGNLHSAFLLDVLGVATPAHGATSEHAHHHHADPDGAEPPAVKKSSADPGCSFAGSGVAATADNAVALAAELLRGRDLPTILPAAPVLPGTWLRPPVRSPPA